MKRIVILMNKFFFSIYFFCIEKKWNITFKSDIVFLIINLFTMHKQTTGSPSKDTVHRSLDRHFRMSEAGALVSYQPSLNPTYRDYKSTKPPQSFPHERELTRLEKHLKQTYKQSKSTRRISPQTEVKITEAIVRLKNKINYAEKQYVQMERYIRKSGNRFEYC